MAKKKSTASKAPKRSKPASTDPSPAPEEAGVETVEEEVMVSTETPADAKSPASPETEQLRERLLRLQADFDNFRKRTTRDRENWVQRAGEDILQEILPVMDHFEMGMNTAVQHETESSVVEGFQLVYDQLQGVLRRFEVEAVDAEGAPFDPHLHEAMTYIPSEEHPAETVIAQTRRGYTHAGRLLRAAQVVVSSGPSEPEAEPPISESSSEPPA